MTRSAWVGRAGLALLLLSLTGCGKSGPPLPPLRPVPGRIADASAVRLDDNVDIRFTVPPANADGTTPSAVEHVEIYFVSSAPGTAPPTVAQLMAPPHLKTRITVRRPPPDETASSKAPPRTDEPLAGEMASYRDPVLPSDRGAQAPVRYYLVVAVAGRERRGAPSGVISVPLATDPPPPTDLAVSYDEHTLKLTWTPAAAGGAFRVYNAGAPGGPPAAPGPPLTAAEFSTPVTFDQEHCYVVRAVIVTGPTTIEGAPSQSKCVTPVDTFPPPVPENLRAIAEEAGVSLSWDAVEAPDLAGYIVLRAEGGGDTLTPLMPAPIAATSFKDTTAARGASYTYVVVSVDTAPAHNRSAPSNRQTVTVRSLTAPERSGRRPSPVPFHP